MKIDEKILASYNPYFFGSMNDIWNKLNGLPTVNQRKFLNKVWDYVNWCSEPRKLTLNDIEDYVKYH